MGGFLSGLWKKEEPQKKPIKGIAPRLKNILTNNFRGIIGCLVPIAVLSWQFERYVPSKKVSIMWMWIIWFFLLQPVSVPVSGLIPVFFLPMSGCMSSAQTCECYMNENVVLFLLASMLLLVLNNSGMDRRIALSFLCSGDACQFSAKRLIFKASTAAFFLSMFSSRLIATATITQYVTPVLMSLKSSAKKGGADPDFDEMRYILNNAIQTASGIGSVAVVHSSYATLVFRGIFHEAPPRKKEFPDIFNYLQYSAFAFPVAFVMFVCNFTYHMMLANSVLGKPMTAGSMAEVRKQLLKYQAELPRKTTLHEKLSVLSTILYLFVFFFRWNQWIDGWSEFRTDPYSSNIPRIKDATTAAIFVIVLHTMPKSYGFLKYLDAEKKSELPPLKAESAILWWRFVDKNTNWGYFLVFGCAHAILNSARDTGLGEIISENFGTSFTGQPWNTSIFLVVFLTSLLCNMMTAAAACAVFLPFVMCMAPGAQLPWPNKVYIGALGVGVASSFGFCFPFMYTPAYFCHHTGKVPIKKMVKYSFIAVWICLIILWLALILWAPYLFDPEDDGIHWTIAQGAGKITIAEPTEPEA
ncbi:protein I'm not dead yet-like [Trichoplusia ni]|uniref:Protein I'm not dead yet-like n=1 Tax=Trichoplusia ni TaxID=7111 RepID=A0A7E5V955_TRINI|nr:protein I'm not dead yet-like [Trichoplusia ni]